MSKSIKSRALVVDCDVIAASTSNENPRSIACRAVLDTIAKVRHQVVITPRMQEEWDRRFPVNAKRWLVSLHARRLVQPMPDNDSGLSNALAGLPTTADIKAIMLKDTHLLEAALVADRTVLSMDETAYYHFCDAEKAVSQISKVMWANPEVSADDCVIWLEQGAKPAGHRCIGRRPRK